MHLKTRAEHNFHFLYIHTRSFFIIGSASNNYGLVFVGMAMCVCDEFHNVLLAGNYKKGEHMNIE